MNKKILTIGIIAFIAIGFYTNGFGLFENNNFEVTSFGTVFDVPTDDVELISSENGTDVFGYNQGEHFYYVISFNYNENPELYEQLSNAICKGKKYEENGVTFYEQTSQVLGNNFNVWTGVNLAIKDQTIVGSFVKNETTGEVIFCISNNYKYVVDTLEDVDWFNKDVKTNNTVNTTSTVEEPVYEDTTTETNNVDIDTDKKTYDNADGIGLSDDEYSKQHQKEIDAYQKGLEDAGYFDEEEKSVSDDASQLTD